MLKIAVAFFSLAFFIPFTSRAEDVATVDVARITTKPTHVKLRNGAQYLLEIDVNSLINDGEVDPDAPAWKAIEKSVEEFVTEVGPHQLLHVQFFFTRDISRLNIDKELSVLIKKQLAAVDVYLVNIDYLYRNDKVTWEQYLQRTANQQIRDGE